MALEAWCATGGQLPCASGCTHLPRLSIQDVETNLGVGATGRIWARRNARARTCVPPTDGPRQRPYAPHAATDGCPRCAGNAGNATVHRNDDAEHGNGNARDARHAAHDDEHDGSLSSTTRAAVVLQSGARCFQSLIVVLHARVCILLQVRG